MSSTITRALLKRMRDEEEEEMKKTQLKDPMKKKVRVDFHSTFTIYKKNIHY